MFNVLEQGLSFLKRQNVRSPSADIGIAIRSKASNYVLVM